MDASPKLEILVREPEGFTVWSGPPFSNGQPQVKLERVPCSSARFCENGSRSMSIKDTTIKIYDSLTSAEIRSFDIPTLLAANLSPTGTYLQTFRKPTKPQDQNVVIWEVENGTQVYTQFQKNMTQSTWPLIRFSADGSVACRMVTNEVQFFDGKDFSKGIVSRLRVPGIAAVELSKAPGSHVAVFIAEAKGAPACVQIFATNKEAQAQPLARRSFFRCSTVRLHWNSGSTGLLVVAQSDVDKSNQSYYGESKLYYLTTDGAIEGVVPLSKEGPIHDVQWSASGLQFAAVYGFMPAKATVFDKKCNPLLELGTGPYNTIRWNPKGRFLCLAGFGNLPGDMKARILSHDAIDILLILPLKIKTFWDFTEKRMLGATKAEWSVTSEWSPDGRYFMTATTAPRLQIDNGIKIFHHNGTLYFKRMFNKLYQADWKPDAPERFSDIAELATSVNTLKIDGSKKPGQEPKPSHASTRPPANVVQKPAAYRPPQAKTAAVAQAELFGESASSQEMSKNALRNKKRREKQKEKKAAPSAADDS